MPKGSAIDTAAKACGDAMDLLELNRNSAGVRNPNGQERHIQRGRFEAKLISDKVVTIGLVGRLEILLNEHVAGEATFAPQIVED